jgi:hypothetical protein
VSPVQLTGGRVWEWRGKAVVGIINHFILRALIFWEKVKVSLVFEN